MLRITALCNLLPSFWQGCFCSSCVAKKKLVLCTPLLFLLYRQKWAPFLWSGEGGRRAFCPWKESARLLTLILSGLCAWRSWGSRGWQGLRLIGSSVKCLEKYLMSASHQDEVIILLTLMAYISCTSFCCHNTRGTVFHVLKIWAKRTQAHSRG